MVYKLQFFFSLYKLQIAYLNDTALNTPIDLQI